MSVQNIMTIRAAGLEGQTADKHEAKSHFSQLLNKHTREKIGRLYEILVLTFSLIQPMQQSPS
jgi:hypothetical protein